MKLPVEAMARAIIDRLDSIARAHNAYEYGLPTWDEHQEHMERAVIEILRSGGCSDHSEAK